MSRVEKAALAPFLPSLPWGVCPWTAVQHRLLPVRSAARLPQAPQSVLVVLFPYLLDRAYYAGTALAKYAVVRDYHLVCGDMLESTCQRLRAAYPAFSFVPFADASPVPEVPAAAAAGLGLVGKNGLLLHEKYGSWVFIGEIVTDLPVACAAAPVQGCHACGRCLAACPTGALSENGVEAAKCLSFLSQEKGALAPATQQLLRQNRVLWGCDRCQDACPLNQHACNTPIEAFYETACPVPPPDISDRAYAWRKAAFARNTSLLFPEESGR